MTKTPDALEITRELIGFNTINPPGNEKLCIEYLGKMLGEAGFDIAYHPFGPDRLNLIARKGGSNGSLPLCFTGHVDTVPLGTRPWSVEPFAGQIEGDKLFGRGTSDMKSGVAAFVVAAINLAEQLAHSRGVVLVITAGEETGAQGAYDLVRLNVLGEAGAMIVAEPSSNRPWIGHKGAMWLAAATRGVTAHGSMPEQGVNAVYKAARAITRLEEFDFNEARHDLLGAPTLNVGNVNGGINVNSVPDAATIGIDIRTIPEQDHQRVRDQISSLLGADVHIETLIDVGGVWTEPDEAFVQEVFAVVEAIKGERPEVEAAPYFTDASALTPGMGSPPTVILGPGEAAMAHQTDEYCLISRIEEAVEIYQGLMRQWCAR